MRYFASRKALPNRAGWYENNIVSKYQSSAYRYYGSNMLYMSWQPIFIDSISCFSIVIIDVCSRWSEFIALTNTK